MSSPDDTRHRVQFLGVPVAEFSDLQVYFDDMVREMQLIAVGHGGEGAAGRLADLAVFVQHDIAGHRNALHARVMEAAARGAVAVDLDLHLHLSSVPDARQLVEVVEALDAQSRSGLLLTAPASEAVIEVLRWIVDEVEGQLGEGRAPQSFADRWRS